MTGEHGSGVVLANFGRGVLVAHGTDILHCLPKGRKQRLVCGDRVRWARSLPSALPTIEGAEARLNLLERIDARGRTEPVAANLDRMAIVVAPEPGPDWFLVDRYWAGARLAGIPALLVVNKSDLSLAVLEGELKTYRALGLDCPQVSALTRAGVAELLEALAEGTTLLVGQSGVGKSSLVNVLAPHAAAQTAALTRAAEGRHTTTTARWYSLAGPAALIDAPGVRDYAPPASSARATAHGFIEVEELAPQCRFSDCRHLEEPDCAVRAAMTERRIAPRRYESYRRLYRLYDTLDARRF